MDVVWIVLALSSSCEAAAGYDIRWDAAMWCVEASYALGVCEVVPGRANGCDVGLVERCLRWTGAGEPVDVEPDGHNR